MLARSLDQFFTRRDVAAECTGKIKAYLLPSADGWLWIEPSAGGGAFYDAMDYPKIGIDIMSVRPDIMEADFLKWHPGSVNRKIAVVGNPPFGKNASLACKFFNHAAEFADIVAFIVPRTFEKPHFLSRLNRHMHLVQSHNLDECSFEFLGEPYSVPTVFQIWERKEDLRLATVSVRTHSDFDFVTLKDAHFAFQRVGARAGLVSFEGLKKSPQSHYFLKARSSKKTIFDRLKMIDWEPIKSRTAGNPSIGKAELVGAYLSVYG